MMYLRKLFDVATGAVCPISSSSISQSHRLGGCMRIRTPIDRGLSPGEREPPSKGLRMNYLGLE